VDRRSTVSLPRWRRQDGFLRGVVIFAAIVVIVGVLGLDAVAVVHASLGVRQDASDAANQALATFVQTESRDMAMNSASTFLKLHNSVLLKADSTLQPSIQSPAQSTVTITATKTPHTYVFHYFVGLPWGIGPWFHRMLNPQATVTNS
jgi:hypothetical protein